ncbi:MAG: winged helix-turn-helix transcriptional regulator [Nanobdellota archaeon]
MENKKNSNLLNILLAAALIMGFIFIVSLSIYIIQERYGLSCTCKLSLPLLIAALTSLGVFVGILTYYFLSKSFSQEKQKLFGNVEKTLNFLTSEERIIISALLDNNGYLAQNNLSEITKINPVKLHRRILALESKGVIYKKKTGMTNKIFLDNDLLLLFTK